MTEVTETTYGKAPALEIDLDVYLPLFEDEGISEDDKCKLLEALWSVIMSYVQLGWGVHPVQQAKSVRRAKEDSCGQIEENASLPPVLVDFMVKSGNPVRVENVDCVPAAGSGKGRK